MGMLNEMFGDSDGSDLPSAVSELLAKGQYVSNADEILSGYKTFQKKYVYKNLVFKLIIVLIALVSSIMMFITSDTGDVMPIFCLMICVACAIYFINEPIANKKKVRKGVEAMHGTEYEAQIFSDKLVISTLNFVDVENMEISENVLDDNDEIERDAEDGIPYKDENDMVRSDEGVAPYKDDVDIEVSPADVEKTEDDEIPATVIHLDSPIVDFIDRSDMFIVVVKKSYVFIIPKAAFSAEEISAVSEKMKLILGIRYKMA